MYVTELPHSGVALLQKTSSVQMLPAGTLSEPAPAKIGGSVQAPVAVTCSSFDVSDVHWEPAVEGTV